MTEPSSEFAALERRGWERVAARYEEAWSGLTRLFISDLLEAVAPTSGTRLLDLACGPGYVAEAALALGAEPEQSPGARIVEDAIRAHADMSAPPPKGPDYFGYGNADTCREHLSRMGFDAGSFLFRTRTAEWKVETASFLFESERDAGVRTTALLATQTPETLRKIRARIEDSVQEFRKENGFAIPYAAHVIAATAG